MILQTASVRFADARRIVVALKPTVPQSRLVMAVIADRPCALSPVGEQRLWKNANVVGCVHNWHRYPTPAGGLVAVEIEAAREISGSVLVLEAARLGVLDSLQLLADLIAGGSAGEPGGVGK